MNINQTPHQLLEQAAVAAGLIPAGGKLSTSTFNRVSKESGTGDPAEMAEFVRANYVNGKLLQPELVGFTVWDIPAEISTTGSVMVGVDGGFSSLHLEPAGKQIINIQLFCPTNITQISKHMDRDKLLAFMRPEETTIWRLVEGHMEASTVAEVFNEVCDFGSIEGAAKFGMWLYQHNFDLP